MPERKSLLTTLPVHEGPGARGQKKHLRNEQVPPFAATGRRASPGGGGGGGIIVEGPRARAKTPAQRASGFFVRGPAELEPATPDYESGATNRLSYGPCYHAILQDSSGKYTRFYKTSHLNLYLYAAG